MEGLRFGSIILLCCVVGSAFVVLCTYTSSASSTISSVELESVILPPKSFRKWVEDSTRHMQNGPAHDVPMDRLAGRGDNTRPTVMPATRAQMELQEANKNVEETKKAFLPKLKEVEDNLLKTPDDVKLLAQKKEYEEAIKSADQHLAAVQAKVTQLNKDLVQGRARLWNKDEFLGGSDHFVPMNQAQAQLVGGGYGHRYSVTDWLSGE